MKIYFGMHGFGKDKDMRFEQTKDQEGGELGLIVWLGTKSSSVAEKRTATVIRAIRKDQQEKDRLARLKRRAK
jgi:hypothetical protein